MKRKLFLILVVGICILLVSTFSLAGCKPEEAAAEEEMAEEEVVEEEVAEEVSEFTAEEQQLIEKFKGKYSDEMLEWIIGVRREHGGSSLYFLICTLPQTPAIKEMTADWEELSGIKMDMEELDLAKTYDKWIMDIQGAKEIDLEILAEVYTSDALARGLVENLTPWFTNQTSYEVPEWFDFEDFAPAFLEMNSDIITGDYYSIPTLGIVNILMYRTDIFEKYNIQLPTTKDELLEVVKFINEQNIVEEGREVKGISFRGRPSLGGANWVFSDIIHAFGAHLTTPEGKPTLNDYRDEAIQCVQYEMDLAKYGVEGIPSFDPSDATNAFSTGFAAILFEASIMADQTLLPEMASAGKVGFMVMPPGPVLASNIAAGGGTSISSYSDNKEAAVKYLTWIFSKSNQELFFELGGAPLRTSSLTDPKNKEKWPFLDVVLEGLDDAKATMDAGYYWLPNSPLLAQYTNIYAVDVSKALAGELTAEECVDNIYNEMMEVWEAAQ